ncbi:hypothetical protein LS68_008110 [Helicobacter sp. MIT 05-5293]|uniref:hypothetical protein n=1 Tax=Helicobacter sp. MIT 05-5293 TaxID=1548149 RepID=UPI00051D9534|nr:hypothetical protein [Helicobacter sp. MIT 05-5293]TLD80172.1 hypothetical protein LS68_008110 [Helicobacter sp. MIT 05-5293]
MLIRNEICENLKMCLEKDIQEARILLDDIAIYDINNAPFIVIKQQNTEISSPSSENWKHILGLEIAIITQSKAQSDALLESTLQTLQTFSGIKNITAINVEKIEIATSEAFSVSIELEIIYFTPSYRA